MSTVENQEVLDALAQASAKAGDEESVDDEPIVKRGRGRPKGVVTPKDKRPPRSEAQQAAFQKVLASRQAKRERDAEEKQLAAARLLLEKGALKASAKTEKTKKPKIVIVQQSESEEEEEEEEDEEVQEIVLVKKPSFGRSKQHKATLPKTSAAAATATATATAKPRPKPADILKTPIAPPPFDPRQFFI